MTSVRILLLFFLTWSTCAQARDGFFLELNNQLNYVNFVEWNDGYAINEESGTIPTLGFSIGYQKQNQYYFEYGHYTGNDQVDYLGYSQLGQSIKTQTAYELESDHYIFGKTFVTTVVYLGYQVNTRDRFIGASNISGGLNEYLDQRQGFVGFKQTIIHTDQFRVDFKFNAKMAFRSHMTVDFEEVYDDSDIHLGMDYTLVSHLYIGKRLPYDWMMGLNLIYEFTEIEQSRSVWLARNGQTLDAVFYHPHTELETYSIGLQISKDF